MNSADNILFEEFDKPENSKIVYEGNGNGVLERESSWIGQIRGLDSFPCGSANGHVNPMIFKNEGLNFKLAREFHNRQWTENTLCWKGCK